MEIIAAGDVALDAVIDELLSPDGLRRLIGHRAIACFALARAAIAPAFYEELIRNVETIDATMRQHVAFIVFHGNASSILRRHPHRSAYYEYHVEGLSLSSGTVELSQQRSELRFSDDLTDAVRWGRSHETNESVAKASEVAASHLARRFGIPETAMPCLLFLAATDLSQPLVVPLSSDETIKSLYNDALAPISDELHLVEGHWELKQDIKWHLEGTRRAKETVARFDANKSLLLEKNEQLVRDRKALDDPDNDNVARARCFIEERARLHAFRVQHEAARTLDEKIAVVATIADGVAILALQQQLKTAEEERKAAFRPDLADSQRQDYRALSSQVNRLRGELGTAAQRPYLVAGTRIREIDQELSLLSRSKADLDKETASVESNLDWLERERTSAEATIANERQFGLADKTAEFERSKSDFLSRGYGSVFLHQDVPPRIEVIRVLLNRGEIGVKRRNHAQRKSGSMLKILFLAANPLKTGRLDLEKEIHAVDRELQTVKFRDQITLLVSQAIQADDLVRLLRDEKPDIVHFSGHGSPDGIIVRDERNDYRPIPGPSLARLLKDRGVKLLVLNSCYSEAQARVIDSSQSAVVGTTDTLDDEAARRFSVAFYRTLGNGHTLADAFRDGGDAVALHDLPDVFQIRGDGHAVYLS
ncbi:CHAT domain-containing protein [Rhizobium leguminosarum]|nr:CHAT domain-containing protein [Rhizobium leguminosarum]